MFGNFYCFAILDWSYLVKSRRVWCVANLQRYGMNPHQVWNQNFMDDTMPIDGLVELRNHLEHDVDLGGDEDKA